MLIFLLHKEYDELILCLKEMASLPWQQKIFVTHEQLLSWFDVETCTSEIPKPDEKRTWIWASNFGEPL
jgi:hypothetical protein